MTDFQIYLEVLEFVQYAPRSIFNSCHLFPPTSTLYQIFSFCLPFGRNYHVQTTHPTRGYLSSDFESDVSQQDSLRYSLSHAFKVGNTKLFPPPKKKKKTTKPKKTEKGGIYTTDCESDATDQDLQDSFGLVCTWLSLHAHLSLIQR